MAEEENMLYRITYVLSSGEVGSTEWFEEVERLTGMLGVCVIPAWIEDIDGNFIQCDFEAYLQILTDRLSLPEHEDEPAQDPVVLASPEASVEGVEMVG